MIKVLVYNDPLNIDYGESIDFDFENFNYKICQDLIEICLKSGKTLQIFEVNNEKKE